MSIKVKKHSLLIAVALASALASQLLAQAIGIAAYGGNNGWFVTASGIEGRIGGNAMVRVDGNNLALGTGGTVDAGLRRATNATIRPTDGGSGPGYFLFGHSVTNLTGGSSPTAAESSTIFQNAGQGASRTVTLTNDPAIGICFEGGVMAAQSLTFAPSAGESIRDGASTGSTQITANTVGNTIRLCSITSGSGAVWLVMSKTGTWTLT